MASVLTEHVRSFGATSDPAERVLPALERLLRYHMRLRSLFAAPPSYLGYPGVSNWSAPGAFEDIVADCYIFAILQRLTALRNQLKIKPNIDGLISRNVANFLLERQRQNDLIGYAVFGNVKAAALEAAEARLIVLENLARGKIHNDSLLRFRGEGRGASTDLIERAIATAAGFEGAIPESDRDHGRGPALGSRLNAPNPGNQRRVGAVW